MSTIISQQGMSQDDALLCPSNWRRMMARSVATGWSDQFCDWVNAEVQRPEFDPTELLQAISSLLLQTFGSVSAHLMEAEADDQVRRTLISMINRDLVEHMQRTRQEIAL